MRITEILLVCFAVSVRVTLLSHGIAISREEHAVTRTGPKRHSDVTHELSCTTIVQKSGGAATAEWNPGGTFLRTPREPTRKPEHQRPFQDERRD